ncbi:MAG: 1-acyl-sn-glycerol-3-phosphate acyltransferase [Clostridia bacterium]|nr:1-acyl-sn-glycerol-3-phosphate acyltransferase [Clostridia bacterium]
MLYRIVRGILKPIFFLFYNVKVEGKHNLPAGGPLLICANHTNAIDPIILAISLPYKMHSMAKVELFKNKFFGAFLRNIGVFPVKRGEADMKSIKTCLKLLKENKIMGMFPEGTRNKTGELKAEPGVAMIAIRSNSPVLPIAIISNYKFFSRTIVRIGKPMMLDKYYDEKLQSEDYLNISMDIMRYIKDISKG